MYKQIYANKKMKTVKQNKDFSLIQNKKTQKQSQ